MISTSTASYRESHTSSTKGKEYEHLYANDRWQQFLWLCEQKVLRDVIDSDLRNEAVRLLDFACGTGRVSHFLEQKVRSCTGIDVSESMLELARPKCQKTELIRADITQSKILDGTRFNMITAFRFFSNAEPVLRAKVMAKLSSLLEEGGVLVFNNHQNAWAPYPLAALWRHRLCSTHNSFYRVMSPLAMHRLCQDCGLEVRRMYGFGLAHIPKIRPSIMLNKMILRLGIGETPLKYAAQNLVAVCRRISDRA